MREYRKPAEELICQWCGYDYQVWYTSNELWNSVVQDIFNFLCPTCFTVCAAEKGVNPVRWALTPEFKEG